MKKNYADKNITGNYFVTIKDKRVTIAPISCVGYTKDAAALPIHFSSLCCDEDTFDIGSGIKLCFDRYSNKLIKNSYVEITNSNKCYSLYPNIVIKFANANPSIRDEILVFWKNGFKPLTGARGKVIDIMDNYVLVKVDDSYYVMDKSGVKCV